MSSPRTCFLSSSTAASATTVVMDIAIPSTRLFEAHDHTRPRLPARASVYCRRTTGRFAMARMRFGIFMAPFHVPTGQNPTAAYGRDLATIQLLDELGYDEAWIGEHHSGGVELIPSPEIFITHAAAQTRHIKLGAGVISLPYHNPLWVADRMILLDHLTRGRAMMGVGPGALPTDATMIGIDPLEQRAALEEEFEVLMHLLR